jgi:hypothetical protein
MRGATQISLMEVFGAHTGDATANFIGSCSTALLDSPATTSATTYKTQFASRANLGSVEVNTNSNAGNATSTIVLMEVTP